MSAIGWLKPRNCFGCFGMKRMAAMFVPNLLNFDPNNHRMRIAQLLNDVNNNPDFLKRVITGDQTWIYDYGIETKTQLSYAYIPLLVRDFSVKRTTLITPQSPHFPDLPPETFSSYQSQKYP